MHNVKVKLSKQTKQISQLKCSIAKKNDKKKEIELLHKRKNNCEEIASRACREKNIELEAAAVSQKKVIEDVAREVKDLKRRVAALHKEKELNVSTVTNLTTQVQD